MKKFILDLTVTENIRLNANYVLLKLTSQSLLPEMLPGQFAELRVDGSSTTFLRRPISINFVDKRQNLPRKTVAPPDMLTNQLPVRDAGSSTPLR